MSSPHDHYMEHIYEEVDRMSVQSLQDYVNDNLTAMFQAKLSDVLYQVYVTKGEEGGI